MPEQQRCFVGIDPGLSGAIVQLYTNGDSPVDIKIRRIPVTKKGKSTSVDLALLNDICHYLSTIQCPVKVILEDVRSARLAGEGKKAIWSLAYQTGLIEMALTIHGLDYEMITPQKWQKVAWLGIDPEGEINEKGKFKCDTKATSVKAMQEKFPGYAFRDGKQKIDQNGVTDALGMALYGSIKIN